MIPIICKTNLDSGKRFKWPGHLPAVPRVGDLIRSPSSTEQKYIELEVVRCTWAYDKHNASWYVEVELWMVRSRFENISAWEKWVNS